MFRLFQDRDSGQHGFFFCREERLPPSLPYFLPSRIPSFLLNAPISLFLFAGTSSPTVQGRRNPPQKLFVPFLPTSPNSFFPDEGTMEAKRVPLFHAGLFFPLRGGRRISFYLSPPHFFFFFSRMKTYTDVVIDSSFSLTPSFLSWRVMHKRRIFFLTRSFHLPLASAHLPKVTDRSMWLPPLFFRPPLSHFSVNAESIGDSCCHYITSVPSRPACFLSRALFFGPSSPSMRRKLPSRSFPAFPFLM